MNNNISLQESYTLPSLGKLDNISPEVVIRSMTTAEEKLRLSSSRFLKTMSTIIDQCVVEPSNFNSYNLTLSDFVFLLYKLRIVSYGAEYKVTVGCSECDNQFKTSVNLDDLNNIDISESLSEPIDIGKLPRSGDTIGIRLLRVSDIDSITKESELIRKKSPDYKGDPSYLLELRKKIVTVNGKVMPEALKEKYVQDMQAIDARYINYQYDKIGFGLDLRASAVCPKCGNLIEFSLPINDEFFRPSFD